MRKRIRLERGSNPARSPRVRYAALASALCLAIAGCADGKPPEPAPNATFSFAIYALSRGKGVPDAARDALRQVDEALQRAALGDGIRIHRSTIGLEGETRVCVEIDDPDGGAKLFETIQGIVEGVALMNLIAEICSPDEDKGPS